MTPNPVLGVFFHWLGGLASASFYVPYRGVKRWAWETFWLVGGFFGALKSIDLFLDRWFCAAYSAPFGASLFLIRVDIRMT